VSPLITVGVAFRNPGEFFELAIKSVLAQTLGSWELLLVDDGSQDGSVELARSVADPRVRVLVDGHSRGLAARLNQVVREARAPFFARMDADDAMHPSRLERQIEFLQTCDEDTVLGTGCYSIDQRSRVVGRRRVRTPQGTGFAARHAFIHPTVAARTSWFRANPYSDQPLFHRSEDAELWCRTAGKARFEVLDEPLLYYREPLPTFSLDAYLGTFAGILQLADRHSERHVGASWLFTRELAKCWLTCVAHAWGRPEWIVRRRFVAAPAKEIEAAQSQLTAIRGQPVPLEAAALSGC
jgi:glycosyltransferase involved in cell wall biosynthesis